MKKIISLFVVLLFATSAFAMENPWDIELPFKNAIIDYKVTGTLNGEKIIYIKDYGRTTAEYSNTAMKMFGMEQPQKEIIITTPDWVHTIDLIEKTGTKQANPTKFLIVEFNNLSKTEQKKVVKNAETLGLSTIAGMDGTIEKNVEKILGYKCDKVTMSGTIAYLFSGTELPMKMLSNNMGIKFDQIATNIKKTKPSSSKFKLPSDIQFQHNKQVDQMMQDRAQTIIESLLSGTPITTSAPGSPAGAVPPPGAVPPQQEDVGSQNQMTPELQDQMKKLMNIFGKPKE